MPAFLGKLQNESICIFAGFRMPLHKKRSPESLWTAIKDHLPGDADDHFSTWFSTQKKHTAHMHLTLYMALILLIFK